MMSNFELSAKISKINLDQTELEQIKLSLSELCEEEEKQIEFFLYCKNRKLAPWMFSQLKKYQLLNLFSEAVQQKFASFYTVIKTENEERNNEAVKFLKEFIKQGIDVIILKGNLFIHEVYKELGYKRMNDFDMLIHPNDWPKVQAIYFKLNYIPLGFGWSGEKQSAAKFSHAGMSFISPNYKCITGTQWGLKSPTSKYTVPIDDAWEKALPFDFNGLKVRQLSPEYNVLHLILHMGVFKCGTRDGMDIYNLYLSDYTIDEDKLYDILKQSNALDKAYFTLVLSNLCNALVSPEFIERIKPKKVNFLMHRLHSRVALFNQTKDLHDSYNDYFHHVEMCVFYFNLFPSFHKRIALYGRLLRLIFFPDREVAYQLSDVTPKASLFSKFKARLKAPYLVLGLTAEEIGWGITFLLLLKFFVDTFLSLKNYLIKKDSYFDYLRSIKVDPEDIKNAVKKIQ